MSPRQEYNFNLEVRQERQLLVSSLEYTIAVLEALVQRIPGMEREARRLFVEDLNFKEQAMDYFGRPWPSMWTTSGFDDKAKPLAAEELHKTKSDSTEEPKEQLDQGQNR